ncbi:hypothetical protein BDN70DRAFT_888256 [Pholiota conissans]|uniref:Uncharacterized protein n=1 Tax=Pholiota conissans TaxID=109636 RepID=A0A9P5YP15_9AGAR|nr:hypothetical protein BDN70DRAFT_888256 [Pholiota conissans]
MKDTTNAVASPLSPRRHCHPCPPRRSSLLVDLAVVVVVCQPSVRRRSSVCRWSFVVRMSIRPLSFVIRLFVIHRPSVRLVCRPSVHRPSIRLVRCSSIRRPSVRRSYVGGHSSSVVRPSVGGGSLSIRRSFVVCSSSVRSSPSSFVRVRCRSPSFLPCLPPIPSYLPPFVLRLSSSPVVRYPSYVVVQRRSSVDPVRRVSEVLIVGRRWV